MVQPPASPQQPAPPPDPLQQIEAQMQQLKAQPTWEDAVQLMRDDGQRGFRVDIETDSTISGDQAADQAAITELLTGITQFWNGVAPALESGYITVDAVKSLTLAAVRRFKLGKVVEDTIDQLGAGEQGKPPQPDPKALEAQFKMANLQFQQQQMHGDMAMKQRQMALDERSMDLKEQEQQQRAQSENAKTMLEHHRETQRLGLDALQSQRDEAAEQARQHLESVKAASEHLRGVLDHVAQIRNTSDGNVRKRVSLIRDHTGRVSAFAVEPDEQGQTIQ